MPDLRLRPPLPRSRRDRVDERPSTARDDAGRREDLPDRLRRRLQRLRVHPGGHPMTARVWSSEQEQFYDEMATGTDSIVLEALAGTGKSTDFGGGGPRAPEPTKLYTAFAKRNQLDLAEKLKDFHGAEA